MAVDTPVLERVTNKEERKCAVPSRMDYMAEEEHNARIKDTYAKLINPENKIEDVFKRAQAETPVVEEKPVVRRSITGGHAYKVESARTNADVFRADSAINAKKQEIAQMQTAETTVAAEEESEDLRPTPTTIQYQTIGKTGVKRAEATQRKGFVFGKREKIIVAVFVAVVVALLTLVIINATVISNLNAEIASVQNSITTVRGAIAGVNNSIGEIIGEILESGINH